MKKELTKGLKELLQDRTRQFEESLKRSPKAIRKAGQVLRSGDMREFRKLLRREGIVMVFDDVQSFADYLVTQRLDLKDLEPEARARLRDRTLSKCSNLKEATQDYRDGILSGADLRCKECQWFVTSPMDGDGEDHDKSCVELGAKGVDTACVGFLWPTTHSKSA